MDLITHAVLTRILIGRDRNLLLAGLGPDALWYITYPPWVIVQGKARHALANSDWPNPPRWMETLHHASHSLPVALAAAGVARLVTGRWPRRELAAWCLHIAIDIPTHSRRFWGPRFLWPLSQVSIEGVPWAEITSRKLAAMIKVVRRTVGGRAAPCAMHRSGRREAGVP
jgi:hypothetical protein